MMINSIVMTDHDDDNYNYVDYDDHICLFFSGCSREEKSSALSKASKLQRA